MANRLWWTALASVAAAAIALGWRRSAAAASAAGGRVAGRAGDPAAGRRGAARWTGGGGPDAGVQEQGPGDLYAGEALQRSHFAGAFAGVGAQGRAEPRVREQVRPADAAPEHVQPGLPDFARGG
jgi:hypothetical protein